MSTGSDHGGGGITGADMDALINNGGYSSIFYSDGCDPNDFEKNSVSKHFINNANGGGGVAFLGNVSFGHTLDGELFNNYFMNALYSNTKISGLAKYDNANYHIGYLGWWASYNVNVYERNYYLKNRNLLGDPEMMVWTDSPQPLNLTATYSDVNKTISGAVSGLTFAATPTVVVTVTAWKGAEIWQTKDINATTASANYTLTNVLADTPGNITVTATAHNYIPKVNTIPVTITGAHPYMSGFVINDDGTTGSVGNSDHFPDAGETIALPVTLTNSGNAASTVTATLTWTADSFQTQSGVNATITINPTYSVSTFGNIAAAGTANNNTSPFRFTVNKNAFEGITPRPLTQFISFTLSIYTGSPSTLFSTKTFVTQITEPHLIKGESTVTPGSPNQLKINLYNTGLSTAMLSGATSASLSKTSTSITLVNGTSQYPNITGVNTYTNFASNTTAFTYTLANGYTVAPTFTLTVTDKYAKTWQFPFSISKPVINTATATMGHYGYLASIQPYWNIALTTTVTVQGYNIYRSNTQNGTYAKLNAGPVTYSTYLDYNPALSQRTQYYYKVTAVDINGNESDPYPSTGYLASTTLSNHAGSGWPVTPEAVSQSITGGRCEGSPITYDLLGDGKKEIFFTSGFTSVGGVWAFNNDGSRWSSYAPMALVNGYIDTQNGSPGSVAIADIDNDGTAELAVATRQAPLNDKKLLVYKTDGIPHATPFVPPTSFTAPTISGWNVVKGPVYSDIDNDGKLEILCNPEVNEGIKVFNSNGVPHAGAGWANTNGYVCGFTMPVAFDFDGDGKKEIVVSCSGKVGVPANITHPAGIYIFKEDGSPYKASNPVYVPTAGYRTDSPPVVADINNDGTYEILFISAKNYTATVCAIKPDGTFITGWDNSTAALITQHHQFTLSSDCKDASDSDYGLFLPTLSVGDLDKDGRLEVVCGDNGHLYVWNYAGTLLKDIIVNGYNAYNFKAPLIADVDDIAADLEIIVSGAAPAPSSGSNIFAYKMNGNSVKGFPISTPQSISNTPCVDDIDNNGTNELIVSTGSKFYVWDSPGAASNNVHGWTSYRHDNLNSGVFYSEEGGYLSNPDNYLQNVTISATPNNMFRYYTGQNILAGYDITTKKTNGDVIFTNGSNIILEGSKSVLLKNNITIPIGCTFEVK